MNILEMKRKLLPMSGPQMSMGGGGGGGSSTGTQTQIQELPSWARGYAKDALEKASALSETPYQPYKGNRIAGFSPMQEQAQEGAANMQTNAGTGSAMGLAGAAALGGLNANYDAGKFSAGQFGNDAAQQYMNPYMQNVVDIQKREANRQAGIQGQQQQAAAVGRGGFGGSRDAMMRSEASRNLNQQLGDIQAVGSSNAYTNAQQQFNADQARNMQAQQLGEQSRQYGAGIGMQGLQTALTGANTLGTLGSQQFQQGMDINKLQNAYGGQQQALRQQGLSQAYQDFQNQQNYPYKQLGFFSDMIRGLPLGQVTSKTMYEPDPSMAQNVAALGAGAYGLSKFMAEGGMAYADGGSVDSQDNISRIVSKLSDQQLQQAAQAAQARGDMDQLEAIQSEMGMRASERRGIAGAVTPQMADKMAGGGVVAFAGDDETNGPAGQLVVSPGNQSLYNKFGKLGEQAFDEYENLKPYEAMSAEDRRALTKKNFSEFQQFAGADPYAPMVDKIAKMDADRLANLEKEKGLAAFEAIPAFLEGRGIRGLGKGVAKIGSGLSAVAKADAAEKRALAQQDFLIKDAQRKERMGLTKDAMAETDKIESAGVAAAKSRREALVAKGRLAADLAKAYRPVGTGSGGAGGKLPQVDRQTAQMQDQLIELKNNPKADPAQIKLLEDKIAGRMKIIATGKEVSPEKANLTREGYNLKEDTHVADELAKVKNRPAYLNAKDEMEQLRVMDAAEMEARRAFRKKNPVNNNSGDNTPPPPPGYR